MKENLKVLMINGSPKANGNTAIALHEMEKIFKETILISTKHISDTSLVHPYQKDFTKKITKSLK